MLIMGIETSCDETAICVYNSKENKIIINTVYTQSFTYLNTGGIIPILSMREHLSKIFILFFQLLSKLNLGVKNIGSIAYTKEPGLIGSLLVGTTLAKTLHFLNCIPVIGINHIEGHLFSLFLNKKNYIKYPYIFIILSGGNTQFIQVNSLLNYSYLNIIIDNPIGNSLDKISKIIGLFYPGGPIIEYIAKKSKHLLSRHFNLLNKNKKLKFTKLKDLIIKFIKNLYYRKINKQVLFNIIYTYNIYLIQYIHLICIFLIKTKGLKLIGIGGGVITNKFIRIKVQKKLKEKKINILYPPLDLSTDNAAMVGILGYFYLKNNFYDTKNTLVNPKKSYISPKPCNII